MTDAGLRCPRFDASGILSDSGRAVGSLAQSQVGPARYVVGSATRMMMQVVKVSTAMEIMRASAALPA